MTDRELQIQYCLHDHVDLYCDYHPHRDAVDKCQRCNRLICLADKQHITPSRRFERLNFSVVCSHCYYELAKENSTGIFRPSVAILVSGVIIMFFGSFTVLINTTSGGSNFLTIFFTIFIIIAVLIVNIVFWISRRMQANPIDIYEAKLLSDKLATENSSDRNQSVDQFCMHCGTMINRNSEYCDSCGEPLYPSK